jgi:hypothetical protein
MSKTAKKWLKLAVFGRIFGIFSSNYIFETKQKIAKIRSQKLKEDGRSEKLFI